MYFESVPPPKAANDNEPVKKVVDRAHLLNTTRLGAISAALYAVGSAGRFSDQARQIIANLMRSFF